MPVRVHRTASPPTLRGTLSAPWEGASLHQATNLSHGGHDGCDLTRAVTPSGNLPLSGLTATIVGGTAAAAHARSLLHWLGAAVDSGPVHTGSHLTWVDREGTDALEDWARSGGMALTGWRGGPPQAAQGSPAGALRGALGALSAVGTALTGQEPVLPGVELLGERAALQGLRRQAPWSVGGACRSLPTRDGWLSISLPRETDRAAVPAIVGSEGSGSAWESLRRWASSCVAAEAVCRAQLLDVPAAVIPSQPGSPTDEQTEHRLGRTSTPESPYALSAGSKVGSRRQRPLVIDLTSLWAGPLCAHLLSALEADVVKIESPQRPDGAREGTPQFFDLLHHGHASVALDLSDNRDVAHLRRLLAAADVVLEGSRSRGLARRGIDAAALVAAGTTWTSITAYGRTGPFADRIGLGDDVAAAAGLVAQGNLVPVPCGDAIADPLTGVHAALATAASLLSQRSHLIDIAMRDIAAVTARSEVEPHVTVWDPSTRAWWIDTPGGPFRVLEPRARAPVGNAMSLGADTGRVLQRFGA